MLFEGKLAQYPNLENLFNQDELSLTESLLKDLEPLKAHRLQISTQAQTWVEALQKSPLRPFNIQKLLQAFPLTHEEGRSLMALAEAYLRIPDSYTANLLLKDKVSGRTWRKMGVKEDTFVRASRWGLDLLSYLQGSSWGSFTQPINLRAFKIFMNLLSREFILGQTIEEAIKRSLKSPQDRFSFDMLGEGARTLTMAKAYKDAYSHAIKTIGKKKQGNGHSLQERGSISVKLSALYPHYTFSHHEDVLHELLPDLIELCTLARQAGISLIIDAEEVARLELSLDLMEKACETSELKGWDGFGLAVQSYQKRAPAVIDWAEILSRKAKIPLHVRLVKGAYWDTEIKIAQIGGYPEYPLFTRKAATDLCYLACAQKLLAAKEILYPQFATHNAYTVAAVLEMSGERPDIEFQRLQGMGEELYKIIRQTHPVAVRVYAPVGNDRDLLPYLVRRLLENGSNTSFVHKAYDKTLSKEEIMGDPWAFFESHPLGRHPQIPLPKDLYENRQNSEGYDLSDRKTLKILKAEIGKADDAHGALKEATLEDLEAALKETSAHWESWDLIPAERRGEILNRAADLIEERRGFFLNLLIKKGKKTLPDAVSELREAVDYCRYYAAESLKHFATPQTLRGPTGELNQLALRGRGVFACISPWNFPLAIFIGQVTAALAAGNAVIAKPASLTPLIAYHAVQVLHEAGVPREVLHYLHGRGSVLGTPLVEDLRVSGVVFTGSTSTAQDIQKSLSTRGGPLVPFIAETGGLNAMIVDSSALIEQVVDDVVVSAFQSAGQRCSALRILFIQEDIYEPTLAMLREAMEELKVGDPQWISTDVGPVIDTNARDEIETYIEDHSPLARTPLPKVKDTFVAPTLIEVKRMEDVKREVFGPVLHVARFKARDLEQVVKSINQSGYGLTMGLESRIETTINNVRSLAHVGNLYINRSMIGAVVGVQPFGGEGLSGSGPKAGGPNYLPRFAVERTFSYNITASGGNVDLLNLEE
ncbi:MAG: hypothetical protein BGO67_00900 [Alphaproteobacteria bacterium 41-28]|nr:MAG: hypothetical protein BGO67_00900 [Alphaproteobacteria bacterium 41-28]